MVTAAWPDGPACRKPQLPSEAGSLHLQVLDAPTGEAMTTSTIKQVLSDWDAATEARLATALFVADRRRVRR